MEDQERLRRCEYYRCWPDMTWDTDFIDIPEGSVDLDQAVRYAVEYEIVWKDSVPCWVGFYAWDCLEEDYGDNSR